jgi:HD-like signal output (HDOD) protein
MTDSKSGQRDTWEGKPQLTAEELIKKLRSALRREGDFPASAKVVSEIRQLTSDQKTTANQITELILREPSLGVRVLHLVNSSFYRRAKPIMTVSQAVVQIGMRPLAEMCAGLVLLQKFVPAARRGGSFANCLRKTILTSLLASAMTPAASGGRSSKSDEQGYLAGSFAELGTLLLAFYFPQVYEAALKRSDVKKQEIGQSIKEITGLSTAQLSLEVIEALDLPPFYKEVLTAQEAVENNLPPPPYTGPGDPTRLAKSVAAAQDLSEVVIESKSRQDLDKVVATIQEKYGFEPKAVQKVMGDLPNAFKSHCVSLDLQLPALPEFVMTFSEDSSANEAAGADAPKDDNNQFNQFVNEIRQAVESREPTASIITSVMETFAWSLGFERVLLLLVGAGKTKLVGRLLLGSVPNFDPKHFERPLGAGADAKAPDYRAFREGRPVFGGDPLFTDGWPLAVIPIGFGQRAIGVIYADRNNSPGAGSELSSREQAAIGILAELLDRSLSLQS